MTEWIKRATDCVESIHKGMGNVLKSIESEDQAKSKAQVDSYLASVAELREVLISKVSEMVALESQGLFNLEKVTLDRLVSS